MSLAASIQLTDQDIRTISSTPGGEALGQAGSTSDGRVYRYALAGASNLAAAELQVNADVDTNVVNKTVAAAAAVGVQQVSVNVSGAVVANAYAGGYFTINDATGEGISYYINGNTGASGSGTITVTLREAITVALTTSSEYTLTVSPFANTVISATDQADQPLGVPNIAVTAANYYWIQTGGVGSVLWDEAVAKGLALTIGTGTAGAVEALDGAGEPQVGIAYMAGVDTEHQPAYLTLW